MNWTDVTVVGFGGALGAVTRFVVDALVRLNFRSRIPIGTVVINVSGSLLLGLLTGLVMYHGAPSMLTTAAGTGFCGGYTTFSTASFETVRLVQQGASRTALTNSAVTLIGALGAGGLGLAVAHL
jgi:CrcB protein